MTSNQCAACGQWAGKGHRCPTHPSYATPVARPVSSGTSHDEGLKARVLDRVARAADHLKHKPTTGKPKMPPTMTRDSDEFARFEDKYLSDTRMTETKAGMMAMELHRGQTDQSGVAYIEHPRAVNELMQQTPQYAALSPEERSAARIAAILHDTLEDTALEEDDLRRAGCSDLEVATILAVTAREGEPKDAYYERIKAAGPVAVTVKIGDLAHNNLPQRRETLPGSPSNPVKDGEDDRYTRLGRKYWKAYTALGVPVPDHLQPFAPSNV